MRKILFYYFLIAYCSLLLSTQAYAVDELKVPIATWGSPSHVEVADFVAPLKKSLQSMTDGRITVEHYPGGSLANEQNMTSALMIGKVKVGLAYIPAFAGIVQDALISSFPNGLTLDEMDSAIDLPDKGIKAVLNKELGKRGVKLLAVLNLGPLAIASNKKIVDPHDLRGLKIRTPGKGTAAEFDDLGAASTVLPFSEVYTAMQRNTIDGTLIGYQGIGSQKIYEVAKYALVPAGFVGSGLMSYAVNLRWWDKQSEADQHVMRKAFHKAELSARAQIKKQRKALAAQYRDEGMQVTILRPDDSAYDEWKKAVVPFVKQMNKQLSPAIRAPISRKQEASGTS